MSQREYANSLYVNKNFPVALKEYIPLLEDEPENVEYLTRFAVCKAETGYYSKADFSSFTEPALKAANLICAMTDEKARLKMADVFDTEVEAVLKRKMITPEGRSEQFETPRGCEQRKEEMLRVLSLGEAVLSVLLLDANKVKAINKCIAFCDYCINLTMFVRIGGENPTTVEYRKYAFHKSEIEEWRERFTTALISFSGTDSVGGMSLEEAALIDFDIHQLEDRQAELRRIMPKFSSFYWKNPRMWIALLIAIIPSLLLNIVWIASLLVYVLADIYTFSDIAEGTLMASLVYTPVMILAIIGIFIYCATNRSKISRRRELVYKEEHPEEYEEYDYNEEELARLRKEFAKAGAVAQKVKKKR